MEEDVKEDVSVSEETESATEIAEEESSESSAGDKTPPNLLLKSLQEEREKRRELEKLLELKTKVVENDETFSDEGRLLNQKIDSLNEKIALQELSVNFPQIKDKSSEFNEFRLEYPGVPLEKLAKLFIAENGLIESPETRKGLEKASGGMKTTPSKGLSNDEITDLRINNSKKYYELLKAGKIKF